MNAHHTKSWVGGPAKKKGTICAQLTKSLCFDYVTFSEVLL
jgi:hypothetical protein